MQTQKTKKMPKPKLPDEQRKEFMLRVRFLKNEMPIIENQARIRNCKSVSQYIRQLIANDIKNNGFNSFGMPEIQSRK